MNIVYIYIPRAAISGLQWPDGTTLTDEALDWGRSQLDSNARDGVPRVIVVLTDGESNDPDRTLASAQAAKAKGIQLYALGEILRNKLKDSELSDYVTVFTLSNAPFWSYMITLQYYYGYQVMC